MYRIDKLEELACDEEFVQQLRTLARDILARGEVRPEMTRHIVPLATYGPDKAGAVLRLTMLDSWATLDEDLQLRRCEMLDQVEAARV